MTSSGMQISININNIHILEYNYNLPKTGNSSRIPNLASEIGALCHIFRDIDVFSAFPEAALLGATLGKALKMSI